MYLSIDLDAWNQRPLDLIFFPKIWALKAPIVLVDDHSHLLPYVNEKDYGVLFNIDHHDDILTSKHLSLFDTKEPIHCGNWVSHVTWKETGKYVWCSTRKSPDWGMCDGTYVWKEGYSTGWHQVRRIMGFPKIPLNLVQAVGIAFSHSCLVRNPTSVEFISRLFDTSATEAIKILKDQRIVGVVGNGRVSSLGYAVTANQQSWR